MKQYTKNKNYTLYNASMLDMLEDIEPNSIDSVITDPPYELGFMGKSWDSSGIAFQPETWAKCLEVLKPGGYLLAFGGSRTFHRIACAIEDAGFEIRDVIMWLYGSGFPKSMNIGLAIDKKNGVDSIDTGEISKNSRPNSTKDNTLYESGTVGKEFTIKKATNKWEGWGTCLKPAYEPIIMARKPLDGTCVDNVLEHGVGVININGCRVEADDLESCYQPAVEYKKDADRVQFQTSKKTGLMNKDCLKGRFPANVVLTYDESDKEEVIGGFPITSSNGGKTTNPKFETDNDGTRPLKFNKEKLDRVDSDYLAPCDSGSASRYFYCAKASKKDRDEGLDSFNEKTPGELTETEDGSDGITAFAGSRGVKKNTHPTVKPVDLMQYLIRLVTPRGGVILDPFMGSGSTGKAAMYENQEKNAGYKFIGIELTDEYLPIAHARIQYVLDKPVQMKLF